MNAQDAPDSTTAEAVGVLASAGDVDFAKLRAHAIEKGYEGFVFDAMVERSALMALGAHPNLDGQDEADVRREVGRHFRERLSRCGSFRQAYMDEVRTLRQLAPHAPESAIRSVSKAITSFVSPTDFESENLTRAQLMQGLLDQARSTASMFRAYGVDDQIVVKHLTKTNVLYDAGVISKATRLIEDDKAIGAEARLRSREKGVSQTVATQTNKTFPSVRGLTGMSGLSGLTALAERVIPKKAALNSPR